MIKQLIIVCLFCLYGFQSVWAGVAESPKKNHGDFNNTVCFVRFADEDHTVFTRDSAYYEKMFNDSASVSSNSMFNYYRQISYRKFFIRSFFVSSFSNQKVVSIQDENKRSYYQPQTENNPEGYTSDMDRLSREQNLIARIAGKVELLLPASFNLDANNDGTVDNLCMIFSKSYDKNTDLLWPHRSTLYIKETYIRQKRVWEYVMLFADKTDNGVLCHETMHVLGAPDLYHTNKAIPSPVGNWDLMSDNLPVPQGMTAYSKYKYGKWIDKIPEISQAGTYVLHPVNEPSSNKLAYKIRPLQNSDEYFIIEYRKKGGLFEGNLTASGILVYRINEKFFGNDGYNGTTRLDELYIFRTNGTTTEEGDLKKAVFSEESGKTSFSPTSNPYPFFSDGSKAFFTIKNISNCGDSISFELETMPESIEITTQSISMMDIAGRTAKIGISSNTSWQLSALPDWLHIDQTSGFGPAELTGTTLSDNTGTNDRNYTLEVFSTNNPGIKSTISVTQRGRATDVPNNIAFTRDKGSVSLLWEAPLLASKVFSEDFEQPGISGWTIQSLNGIGWQQKYQPAKSKDGYTSVTLNYDYEHQDEWLISPAFANGSILSFYSHSSAKGRQNGDQYTVEVSRDGGQNWDIVWNLVNESKKVNTFERVNIDLRSYLSDNMKIAFHGKDTRNEGISYPWTVDAISIHQANGNNITYSIYRNNAPLSTTGNLYYNDRLPDNGTYVYTIQASNTTITTPFSESITVVADDVETAIDHLSKNEYKIFPNPVSDILVVETDGTASSFEIRSVTGTRLLSANISGNRREIDVRSLEKGIYIIRLQSSGQNIYTGKIVKY